MFRAIGYDDEDLASPIVGIANPAADITSCNVYLDDGADAAYEGIDESGGMPIKCGTITISDAISIGTDGMKASLVSREVIANSVELVAFSERLDGLVTVAGCDKNLPGMLMAAIRTDLPTVFLYGGSVLPGEHQGRDYNPGIRGRWRLCFWRYERRRTNVPGATRLSGGRLS